MTAEQQFAKMWWLLYTRPWDSDDPVPVLSIVHNAVGDHWWRLAGANGEIMAFGETHKSASDAWRAAWRVAETFSLLWRDAPLPMTRPRIQRLGGDDVVLIADSGRHIPTIRIRRPRKTEDA